MPGPRPRCFWLERPRITGLHRPGSGAVAADRCGPLLRELPAGKAAKRRRHPVRIAVVSHVVDKRARQGLGEQVIVAGAAGTELGQLQLVEDVEGLIADLVVGGDIRVVPVGGWLFGQHLGAVILKISCRQDTPRFLNGLTDALGHLS